MPNAPEPSKGKLRPVPNAVRVLPDFAVCRARRSGVGDLVYCLVPNCQSCRYAERHAFNDFCFHPDWEKIVSRTEAGLKDV